MRKLVIDELSNRTGYSKDEFSNLKEPDLLYMLLELTFNNAQLTIFADLEQTEITHKYFSFRDYQNK